VGVLAAKVGGALLKRMFRVRERTHPPGDHKCGTPFPGTHAVGVSPRDSPIVGADAKEQGGERGAEQRRGLALWERTAMTVGGYTGNSVCRALEMRGAGGLERVRSVIDVRGAGSCRGGVVVGSGSWGAGLPPTCGPARGG